MFKLLRSAGWIGGLAALARTPMGQKATAKARAYLTSPQARQKFDDVRGKVMRSRTGPAATGTTPGSSASVGL